MEDAGSESEEERLWGERGGEGGRGEGEVG